MDAPAEILIVHQDVQILMLVAKFLREHGFRAHAAQNTVVMAETLERVSVDLIVLDLMLPSKYGLEICRELRRTSSVPIIMLTAKTSDEEIVQGLKLGADDYVAKPFSIQQLILRIEAVLRRSKTGVEQARTIQLGNLSIDTENLSGQNGSHELSFTKREIELLAYLAQHPDRPIPRE